MGTRFAAAAVVTAACLVAMGCDDPDDGSSVEPTLSSIQEEVFTPKCTLPSCHSVQFHAGNLVLVEGQSHEQLQQMVEHAAAQADGVPRITPGDPDASFLWLKLQPDLDPRYGALMPDGSGDGLPDDELEAIREWIEMGAPAD